MFLCRQISRVYGSVRHFSSALYVTGDKASSNFVVLTPHIDFDERLENREELEQNIKLRQKNIDLDKYQKYWDFYKHLNEKLYILDATKHAISESLSELMKDPEKNKDDIEKFKLHAKLAKDNYKNLRDYIYPVEECAALNILSIPNILDERTPHSEDSILHIFMDKPIQKSKSHFELAINANLIYYLNPTFLLLQNEAAIFEHAVINYAYDTLLNYSFVPMVNASFSRSIIVEGCCTDYINPSNVFTISEEDSKYSISKLHFVGNSSLYSFMAYFTKFSIQLGYFPLKFFGCGKQYYPVKDNDKSLLNLSQYSTIETFLITKDDIDYTRLFEELLRIVKHFYESLGYHYRLVYLPANKLKDYESLHLSIQMFSSHIENYIEVGNISLCDNYLSKRLLVTYNEDKIRKYPNIICGTLVNVQRMLACILEYNDLYNKEILSDKLMKFAPF